MMAETEAPTSAGYGSPRLTTDIGSECAEKRRTTLSRASAGYVLSESSMLRATACVSKEEEEDGVSLDRAGKEGPRAGGTGGTHVDEARVRAPPVNDAPLELLARLCRLALAELDALLPHLVEAAAGRRARVLRILGEGDGALDTVALHLVEARLGERVGVAEGDVGLVRRRLGRQLVEELDHALALRAGPLEDGRAAADSRVLRLDLGRPTASDEGCEGRLEGEGDQVCAPGGVLRQRPPLAQLRTLQRDSPPSWNSLERKSPVSGTCRAGEEVSTAPTARRRVEADAPSQDRPCSS